MTKTTISTIMPGRPGPVDPRLLPLIGEDETTFSARERITAEEFSTHGETYWAQIDRDTEAGTMTLTTDEGHPGTTVRVTVSAVGRTNLQLCLAVAALVDKLLEVD